MWKMYIFMHILQSFPLTLHYTIYYTWRPYTMWKIKKIQYIFVKFYIIIYTYVCALHRWYCQCGWVTILFSCVHMYERECVCACVRVYVCNAMYAWMHVCMYVYIHKYTSTVEDNLPFATVYGSHNARRVYHHNAVYSPT